MQTQDVSIDSPKVFQVKRNFFNRTNLSIHQSKPLLIFNLDRARFLKTQEVMTMGSFNCLNLKILNPEYLRKAFHQRARPI